VKSPTGNTIDQNSGTAPARVVIRENENVIIWGRIMKDSFLQVEDSIKRAKRKAAVESAVLLGLGAAFFAILAVKFLHF
jgi:hypothetical protein